MDLIGSFFMVSIINDLYCDITSGTGSFKIIFKTFWCESSGSLSTRDNFSQFKGIYNY